MSKNFKLRQGNFDLGRRWKTHKNKTYYTIEIEKSPRNKSCSIFLDSTENPSTGLHLSSRFKKVRVLGCFCFCFFFWYWVRTKTRDQGFSSTFFHFIQGSPRVRFFFATGQKRKLGLFLKPLSSYICLLIHKSSSFRFFGMGQKRKHGTWTYPETS